MRAAVLLLVCGCVGMAGDMPDSGETPDAGGQPPSPDASQPVPDGGTMMTTDSGVPDAGTAPDSGAPMDAGSTGVNPAVLLLDGGFIDWSATGVTGGIPVPGQRCMTLDATATVAQINSAIAGCAGKEVYLGAGTYTLTDYIDMTTSNVTLRGAGPGQTILNFTGGWSNGGVHLGGGILLMFNTPDSTHLRDWTGGYAQGETVLTVSSTSGMAAGQPLLLDQLNDDAVSGATGPIDVTENFTANGGTEVSRSMGTRALQQYVKIARVVDGTHVEITPGLYMPTWRASQQPQVYYFDDWNFRVGVEDLTIMNVGGAQSNVQLYNCYDCWMKNIESRNSNNAHVISVQTAHMEIRDSYFYGTMNGDGDSRALFLGVGSDFLVENNIFEHIPLPISIWGPQGAVVAYNFTTDSAFVPYPQIMIQGITTECGYTSMSLFEGNYTTGLSADNNHGASGWNVYFRNRFVGWETGKTSAMVPITVNYMNHYQELVGNLLGEPGYHDNFEISVTNPTHEDSSIYDLGFWIYTHDTTRVDARVESTLLRTSNWDPVSTSPAIGDLPDSMYLKAKPAWWGSADWPPFDPKQPALTKTDLANEYLKLPAGQRWHAMFPAKAPTEVSP
jgi:hypothetical protein